MIYWLPITGFAVLLIHSHVEFANTLICQLYTTYMICQEDARVVNTRQRIMLKILNLLIVEIITIFICVQAKPLLNDKKRVMEVVDPVLEGAHPAKGAEMVGSLISSCLQLDPDRRPNMNTVHNILSLVYDIPFNSVKAKLQVHFLQSP